MDDWPGMSIPTVLPAIEEATLRQGFDMPSERRSGALLRTLAASKLGGLFLEMGTGTGLATAWLLDGMDMAARLVSVDIDPALSQIAHGFLGAAPRLTLIVADGNQWLAEGRVGPFDMIFADAFPGKYESFEDAWRLLKSGGVYVIDDMLPQPNWPQDHQGRVLGLLNHLDAREDCCAARLAWASGLVVAVRR